MEYRFSEHFPSWCTESENLLVTVLSGQVINHKKKEKIKKTRKKEQTKWWKEQVEGKKSYLQN